MDNVEVRAFLQPAVEAIAAEASRLETDKQNRLELIEAGKSMAALLLEREIPTEVQLYRTVRHDVTTPRRFLPDRSSTTFDQDFYGQGWNLFKKAGQETRDMISLYEDVLVPQTTHFTNAYILQSDGNFAGYRLANWRYPYASKDVRVGDHPDARYKQEAQVSIVNIASCEQPNDFKRGLAELAMRYDLV